MDEEESYGNILVFLKTEGTLNIKSLQGMEPQANWVEYESLQQAVLCRDTAYIQRKQ